VSRMRSRGVGPVARRGPALSEQELPLITIPVSDENAYDAGDQLAREVERLEVAGKRIAVIRYPPRFADKLGVAQAHNSAVYRGHRASAHTIVPYEIVIEHD
jgi:hypothetical protein